MASYHDYFLIFLFLTGLFSVQARSGMNPLTCSLRILKCTAQLYHINRGVEEKQLANLYSVKSTQIRPILYQGRQDYLITIPCSCKLINGTIAYFYDTLYQVQPGDSFFNVSTELYSGQAWRVGNEEGSFVAGEKVPMHLLCGCVDINSQVITTYTIQAGDTLSGIASLLSSTVKGIQELNRNLAPGFIDEGWVLFVPKETGSPAPSPGSLSF